MPTCSEVSLKHMKQRTSTMLKNTLHGANRRPYSVTLYTIFYTYVRDYKYRSQMDPYHYELYTKSILNNKLLLLAVTEPTK